MTENIETTSRDMLSDQLARLSDIFPQFVKEGEIDFDAFRAFFDETGLSAGDEKYGLSWAGKSDAFRAIRVPSTGSLAPQKVESRDWDTTGNVFIEGDNLEVLKLLQKRYYGAVKMIYIDPPYNTGKDFVYKDNFTESVADYYERTGQSEGGIRLSANTEKNGRYHSDWLTMMYPRLFLAKNLLREDGVIFVSIDDNEVANLRLVMDEIFGEENFVAQITVVGNPRGRDYGGVARMHDYVLIYSRSEEAEINDLDDPQKEFPFEDIKGGFEIRELRNRNVAFHVGNRPNLYYPFYVNPNERDVNGFLEISLEKKDNWVELFPKMSQGFKTVWRWGKPRSSEYLNSEIVGKSMEDGGYQIVEKYREKSKMARSVWWDKKDNTEKGTLELKDLFEGRKFFDFPKSSEMLRNFVEMGTRPDEYSVVLDFFAGSGTTAHAVMAQNAEDGGNRKWICVQIPEETDEASEAFKAGYKTISAISRERIRRAGEKIASSVIASAAKQSSGSDTEVVDRHDSSENRNLAKTNVDTGFKAYTLSPSNYRKWRDITGEDDEATLRTQIELFAKRPLADDFDEEGVVYEILVKEGFDLNASVVGPAPLPEGELSDKAEENSRVFEGEGRAQIPVWTVTDGDRKLVASLAGKVSREAFDALGLSATDTFVCLDSALDDTTKLNLARSVNLKTI